MSAATRKEFELKGIHVLAALLLFFGVTIGVNIAFATFAIRSFPGEDRQSPYQQGLQYNETLDARRVQAALGWRTDIRLTPASDGALLSVSFMDRTGQPLDQLIIDGVMRRPTAGKLDVPLHFVHSSNGLYKASIPRLEHGVWNLRATARDGTNGYVIDERLQWQPSQQR